MHLVLLGDSTFDNASYVAPGQAVIDKLRARMPAEWRATLLAVDGAVTRGVARQLGEVPADATHLIVSVGGNDALGQSGVLSEPERSVAGALGRLARIRDAFTADYRAMLDAVLAHDLPTAISTIYEARFPDEEMRAIAATALTVLNDQILREASGRGLPLIDLRVMFSRDEHYANAIEPSGPGGEAIAAAITALVGEHDFARRRAEIFVG